jgi:hypothetical protein
MNEWHSQFDNTFSARPPLLHSFVVQNSAAVQQVMREIQALNASVQLLHSRMNKLALGKSDEGVVKSKVRV